MTDKLLAEAIEDYTEARQGQLAESTWKAHSRQLDKFFEWASSPRELGPTCLLVDITDKTCTQYFNRVRFQAGSGSTVNNYRQYLRSFFQFCLGEGWIPRDPMRHVRPMPVKRRPRLQLSARELLQALEGATPRDRIGLAVGMNTGLRASDIARLKVEDVNLTNNTLHAFIEKTDTYEDLPVTSDLRAELFRWFEHYGEAMGLADWRKELPNDWTLVPPTYWTAKNVWEPRAGGVYKYKVHGTYKHIWEIPQRALARMGHPTKDEGFHTIRRSAARRVYELAANDVAIDDPIRIAQSLCGHKNQHTTEIYLGLEPDRRRRDDLMRGRSFLSKVAEMEIENTEGGEPGGLAAVGD